MEIKLISICFPFSIDFRIQNKVKYFQSCETHWKNGIASAFIVAHPCWVVAGNNFVGFLQNRMSIPTRKTIQSFLVVASAVGACTQSKMWRMQNEISCREYSTLRQPTHSSSVERAFGNPCNCRRRSAVKARQTIHKISIMSAKPTFRLWWGLALVTVLVLMDDTITCTDAFQMFSETFILENVLVHERVMSHFRNAHNRQL